MKTKIGPSQIICTRILRCLQGAAAIASVATLALATSACGDDKKEASSGGQTPSNNNPSTNPANNSNSSTPATNKPGTTDSGTTTPAPTGTDIKVVLDGAAVANDGMYAVLSSDNTKVYVYPYDYCAWIAAHDPSSYPFAPLGAGLTISVGSAGANAAPNSSYTINKGSGSVDANVSATHKVTPTSTPTPGEASQCDIGTRGAVSGTVSWSTVSSTEVAGTIDAGLLVYQPGTASTAKGTFIAKKCATTASNATPYGSDPDACHDTANPGTSGSPGYRPTTGGVHYN